MQTREWEGYEVGDADAAGALCNVSGDTYQAYTRREWTTYRKPPTFVTRDLETGKKLYPLRRLPGRQAGEPQTVEEWHQGRPGSGYWGRHRDPAVFAPVEKSDD